MPAGFLNRVEASCARAAQPADARPTSSVPISVKKRPPASDIFVSAKIITTVASANVNFRNIPTSFVVE